MYFWRIGKLKEALLTGGVTELAAFGYLLLYVFFEELGQVLPGDEQSNIWSIIINVVSAFLFLLAIVYAFWKNGGSYGRDFLKRFFSVGWVVSVRVFIFFILPTMIIFFAINAAVNPSMESNVYELLWLTICEIVLIWRIGHHIGDLAAMEKKEGIAPAPSLETAI